jgi:hypothetical protein
MSPQSPEFMEMIEQQLQRSLRPVNPNPAFVNRLQTHLTTPGPTLSVSNSPGNLALAMALGLGAGLLILLIVRQFR